MLEKNFFTTHPIMVLKYSVIPELRRETEQIIQTPHLKVEMVYQTSAGTSKVFETFEVF